MPRSGTLLLDGNLITYLGLEPITVSGTNAAVINLTAGDDPDVVLETFGGGLRISGSTFETTDFAIPSSSLTINLGDGNDKITIRTLPAGFTGTLTINGGIGNDEVVFEDKSSAGTYAFDGGAGTADKITAVRTSGDFTLTSASLTADGDTIALSNVEQAALTGGNDDTNFTVSSFAGNSATLTGGVGNDFYHLANAFGHVTLTADVGTGTLDFTAHTGTLTVSADKTSITSSDGSVLTQALASIAREIDVKLLGTPKQKLQEAFNKLASYVSELGVEAEAERWARRS